MKAMIVSGCYHWNQWCAVPEHRERPNNDLMMKLRCQIHLRTTETTPGVVLARGSLATACPVHKAGRVDQLRLVPWLANDLFVWPQQWRKTDAAQGILEGTRRPTVNPQPRRSRRWWGLHVDAANFGGWSIILAFLVSLNYFWTNVWCCSSAGPVWSVPHARPSTVPTRHCDYTNELCVTDSQKSH